MASGERCCGIRGGSVASGGIGMWHQGERGVALGGGVCGI